jgi:hypothetical protein
MEVEIMKGIPRASRIKRVALYVAVGLALGWVTKTIVAPQLQTYLSIKDPVEGFRRFRWVMIGIGASLIPVAVYFAILAARIIRSGQFPYPGMKLLRDTKIVRGTRALVRGWMFAFCALSFLGLAVYAAYIPATVAKHARPASTGRAALKVIPALSSRPVDE